MSRYNEQMTKLDPIHENNALDKAKIVVGGNCIVCGKQLNHWRLFVCKECEQ